MPSKSMHLCNTVIRSKFPARAYSKFRLGSNGQVCQQFLAALLRCPEMQSWFKNDSIDYWMVFYEISLRFLLHGFAGEALGAGSNRWHKGLCGNAPVCGLPWPA